AEKLRASLTSCAAVDEHGRKNGLAGDLQKPGEMVKVADLPRGLAQIVAPLQNDQMSQPVPTETGIMMFMVCGRKSDLPRAARHAAAALSERSQKRRLRRRSRLIGEMQGDVGQIALPHDGR